MPSSTACAWLEPYLGKIVVCDLDEFFLVIGTLAAIGDGHLAFADADLHDHREANSTKEVYIVETRKIGVRVNRSRLSVPMRRLVAISCLDEVVA
ncbi:MAG: hypothetical protein H0V44_11785 [Planctomycetes bacterium]|nr:hypothetical protein [Planctomycetota bacterium]